MSTEIAHKHHFVPRFILRPWAVRGDLHGYYWDTRKRKVRVRKLGVGGFCRELDLFSLETSLVPRDALEREFFGHVDNRGAKAANRLVEKGPNSLCSSDRSDFARLLMSLEVRRPYNIAAIREEGAKHFEYELDQDVEILELFNRERITNRPSEFWHEVTGASLKDHALLMVQKFVDSSKIGKAIIGAYWRVYQLGAGNGSFVLSDRPLIRTDGYDQPQAIWALPLSPKALFVACNSQSTIRNFDRQSPRQLRKG